MLLGNYKTNNLYCSVLGKSSGKISWFWSFGSLIQYYMKSSTMAKVEVRAGLVRTLFWGMRLTVHLYGYMPQLSLSKSVQQQTQGICNSLFLQTRALNSTGAKSISVYESQKGLQEFASLAAWLGSLTHTQTCYKSHSWDCLEIKPLFCQNKKY